MNDVGGIWRPAMLIPVCLLILVGIFVGVFWSYRSSTLPSIVVLTGPDGGAYSRIGKKLKLVLENTEQIIADKILIKETDGSRDNISLLHESVSIITKDGDECTNPCFKLIMAQADTPLPAHARLVTPLYQERLYILARNNVNEQQPTNLRDYLEASEAILNVFAGEEGSGTRPVASKILNFLGMDKNKFKALSNLDRNSAIESFDQSLQGGTEELDLIFLLDTYPSDHVHRLIKAGAILLSLADIDEEHNEVDTLQLQNPSFESFVLPARSYANQPPVQTLSISALLMTTKNTPNWVVQQLTSSIFEERGMLAGSGLNSKGEIIPEMQSLTERYEPSLYSIPYHPGAEAYYRRNSPSALAQNAELIALVITVMGLAISAGMWIAQLLSSKKKNLIDGYYNEVLEISQKKLTSDVAELLILREKLDKVRDRAFDDLVHERVEANESFLIFQNFIQGQIQAIEAKLDN